MSKFERQILHFDGDSFFASVEQMMNYRLRGKVMITGRERGIITSASIEAKRLGITRGVRISDAKKMYPGLIIVPGDYLSYSIFAHRMYNIVREFTSIVEEYSIDECFADITGLDKVYKKSYEEIGQMIKDKLETSLGVTFGVGLAPNKVLAKVASKHKKPGGFTVINPEVLPNFLHTLPIGKVWGIGAATSNTLNRLGIVTAEDFKDKTDGWLETHKISKPYREIHQELQGKYVLELALESATPKSIIKSKTFYPATSSRNHILSQLSKNIEAACSKARRHRVRPKDFRFYLKTQEFKYVGFDVVMPISTSSPVEIMKHVRENLDEIYRPRTLYRATGVCLSQFADNLETPDLFGESKEKERSETIFKIIDKIAHRYGEDSVHLATSLTVRNIGGSDAEKHLDIPFLGVVR